MADDFETYGARWIFIVKGVSSPSSAADFVQRYGATFGYATNDADNSAGSYTVANSGLVWAEPWIGVIRASDMRFMQHDAQWGSFDPLSIAQSLASD